VRLSCESVEDIDELVETLGALRLTLLDAFRYALFYMASKNGQADPVQRGFGGRKLLKDLDAKPRLLDHASNAADLSFDTVQASYQGLLLGGIQHTR
jgi:hypothetical protein